MLLNKKSKNKPKINNNIAILFPATNNAKPKMHTKIITIIGTRPEIIRLSRLIPKLDKKYENILVHTGQNYDYELDRVFLKELKIRKPNYYLNARGSFAKQISTIINSNSAWCIKTCCCTRTVC